MKNQESRLTELPVIVDDNSSKIYQAAMSNHWEQLSQLITADTPPEVKANAMALAMFKHAHNAVEYLVVRHRMPKASETAQYEAACRLLVGTPQDDLLGRVQLAAFLGKAGDVRSLRASVPATSLTADDTFARAFNTALEYAARGGHLALALELLQVFHADLDRSDLDAEHRAERKHNTALWTLNEAARTGQAEFVAAFIKEKDSGLQYSPGILCNLIGNAIRHQQQEFADRFLPVYYADPTLNDDEKYDAYMEFIQAAAQANNVPLGARLLRDFLDKRLPISQRGISLHIITEEEAAALSREQRIAKGVDLIKQQFLSQSAAARIILNEPRLVLSAEDWVNLSTNVVKILSLPSAVLRSVVEHPNSNLQHHTLILFKLACHVGNIEAVRYLHGYLQQRYHPNPIPSVLLLEAAYNTVSKDSPEVPAASMRRRLDHVSVLDFLIANGLKLSPSQVSVEPIDNAIIAIAATENVFNKHVVNWINSSPTPICLAHNFQSFPMNLLYCNLTKTTGLSSEGMERLQSLQRDVVKLYREKHFPELHEHVSRNIEEKRAAEKQGLPVRFSPHPFISENTTASLAVTYCPALERQISDQTSLAFGQLARMRPYMTVLLRDRERQDGQASRLSRLPTDLLAHIAASPSEHSLPAFLKKEFWQDSREGNSITPGWKRLLLGKAEVKAWQKEKTQERFTKAIERVSATPDTAPPRCMP